MNLPEEREEPDAREEGEEASAADVVRVRNGCYSMQPVCPSAPPRTSRETTHPTFFLAFFVSVQSPGRMIFQDQVWVLQALPISIISYM